jgi:hypothetical protein
VFSIVLPCSLPLLVRQVIVHLLSLLSPGAGHHSAPTKKAVQRKMLLEKLARDMGGVKISRLKLEGESSK